MIASTRPATMRPDDLRSSTTLHRMPTLSAPNTLSAEPPVRLRATPLTAAAFAPFGWVVEAGSGAGQPVNDGSSQRTESPGPLALTADGGQACLAVFRARARDPQGPWQVLERHARGSQTFVPLAGARCVVLVALGADAPDPATLAAFSVSGQQGYTLHPGIWHHGLLALDDGDFVVIERRGALLDCDEARLPQPVQITLD
jgi:ureidoglycolate lyase